MKTNKVTNRLFALLFLSTSLLAGPPGGGGTWTNTGGTHGGITPSGNYHQGVSSGTMSNGADANVGGGTSVSPDSGGFTDNGGNEHGWSNPADNDNQGLGDPLGGGGNPNVPVNPPDGGGDNIGGGGGNMGGGGGNMGGGNMGGGGGNMGGGGGNMGGGGGNMGGGGDGGGGDGGGGDGGGDDSYVSSEDNQTNGAQNEEKQKYENEVSRRAIGFEFKPFPIVMADVDLFTHIVNLDDSGETQFESNPTKGKKIAKQSNKGFKVVQMRKGSLTLGVGTSGGLTGVLSDSAAGVLPKLEFKISVSAGGTHVAERYVDTYEQAEALKKRVYTSVPDDLKDVQKMNIGDSLAYNVTGTLAAGIGVKAVYGAVGAGVGAQITGTWTKQIQRVPGLSPSDKDVRVQVAYVNGRIREAKIHGAVGPVQGAQKWYDTLDETIAYEFNLSKPTGLKLYRAMLSGNILDVKYEYMKQLARAERINDILGNWYWANKNAQGNPTVTELTHKRLLKNPNTEEVFATLIAKSDYINQYGGLKKFEELTLKQVENLDKVTNVSRSTLRELINHKKGQLKLSGEALKKFIRDTYKIQFLPYYRLAIHKNANTKKIRVKNGWQKDLVQKRIVEYKKKKIIDDDGKVNRKWFLQKNYFGKWKRATEDTKRLKQGFSAVYLDQQRLAILKTMKQTFDVFMVSVGRRTAVGTKKSISSGVPILFNFNYVKGNDEQSVVTGTIVEDGLLLKNYIGSYKAENRTAGVLSHHHTRTTAFYAGISDLTTIKPMSDIEVNARQKGGLNSIKKVKMFAFLKYAYDRNDADESEWYDELKNLSERIGFRDYVVVRERPYNREAQYLQLTADWILSQESLEYLMKNGESLRSRLTKTALELVDQWFEKNDYHEDNTRKLSDEEIRRFLQSKQAKYNIGLKTLKELNALKSADDIRERLHKMYYNDHKEICVLSKVGTVPTRNSCEAKWKEEVIKDVDRIVKGLEKMDASNPLKPGQNLSQTAFNKKAKEFTNHVSLFGSGIVNNQFIVNGLIDILAKAQESNKGVDQHLVMQWQGSTKFVKGKKVPTNARFERGSFIMIPSKSTYFKGNKLCMRRNAGQMAPSTPRCIPGELDPI